jgi:DNA-binding LacI/PurR family transcriptional regulator
MAGFRDAAESRGARCAVIACEENFDAVQRQLIRIFNDRPALTGLVVHNEAAVGHVLAVLRSLGRSVPRDVSVVAICPDEVAERSTPPLDSVLIPAEEVGNRAVELLMRKIEGGSAPDATLLPPRLTARASTAPARTTVTSV